MHTLYSGQKNWVKGKTPEEMTKYLKKFLIDKGIKLDFEKCLADKAIEDYVLNDRIEGVKKFKVNATPTIIINDKKFEKALNYKNLKKYLEKLI
jgi:protein-disulfide isomerase